MSIPYGHQSIDEGDIAAVTQALRGDWLTMGPTVARFEQAITDLSGSLGAVAVTSGTAALHAAYAALKLEPGSEVITSPLTFVATAATAVLCGAKIQFADVQEDTGNIDPLSAAAIVNDSTRVIAAVDYAGHPVDINELRQICDSRDITLLEDAAHSIGSTYRGKPVGSLADVTTFSFFPTKNLTTAEGGAIAALNETLLENARKFRTHGLVRDRESQRYPDEGPWHQEVHELGLNYRLPDVLSALGISQLGRIQQFKEARKQVFARYVEGLQDVSDLTLPSKRDFVDPMWHLFPVRVPETERRRVFDFLRENGVLVQVNYIPVYWHPYFEDQGYKRGLCPIAEQFYREVISLPMYASLTPDDQDRVIDLVRKALS